MSEYDAARFVKGESIRNRALRKHIERLEAALEEARRERDEARSLLSDLGAFAAVTARVEVLEEALRKIRDTEWVENALNPQGPAEIARRALSPQTEEPATEGEKGTQ